MLRLPPRSLRWANDSARSATRLWANFATTDVSPPKQPAAWLGVGDQRWSRIPPVGVPPASNAAVPRSIWVQFSQASSAQIRLQFRLQQLFRIVQAGTDRPDGTLHDLGNFLVAQAIDFK